MAHYEIGVVTVKDPSWVESHIPNVQALVEKHGGRYLARSQNIQRLEGGLPQPSVAAIPEFPGEAQAKAFYESGECKPYLDARQAGSDGELFLVEGM